MRLISLEFDDPVAGWSLCKFEFFNDITLLVGLSGVGKTRILDTLERLKAVAQGKTSQKLFGVQWSLVFEHDKAIYEWNVKDQQAGGHFSSRKVFSEDMQKVTSVEVGRGGVWLMCPPQLLFIADKNGDDLPDGAPEVVLDGFEPPPENYHNFANGLRWGPDGWLYGRCGASAPGEIGAPGTALEQRIPMRGGVWRYHPQRKTFEAVAHGTTNPWGHDWNEHGELFFINTVNGHLWQVTPGAHFMRPHTIDPNPRPFLPAARSCSSFGMHW